MQSFLVYIVNDHGVAASGLLVLVFAFVLVVLVDLMDLVDLVVDVVVLWAEVAEVVLVIVRTDVLGGSGLAALANLVLLLITGCWIGLVMPAGLVVPAGMVVFFGAGGK